MTMRNKIANILFFNRSIRNADIIWTISRYTKERIEYYFPKRKCEDIFVGCSVDRNLYHRINLSYDEKKCVREKYGINERFILFVGSLEPRKNLPFLLELIPDFYSKTGIQLVVVGARGWKTSSIKDIVENEGFLKESTVFCGYVSSEDLVKLYNIADCFVSTSLNEGFGLPQLEAFLCGCPVVTAANSAMIEVANKKSGAMLIDGFNKEEWIDKLVSFIDGHPEVKLEEFSDYDWNLIVKNLILLIA